jgi:hypothetical protein
MKCQSGSCVNQTSDEDLKDDCDDEATCMTGMCNGSAGCGFSQGGQPGTACSDAMCFVCDGVGHCVTACDKEVSCLCECNQDQYCGANSQGVSLFNNMCFNECGVYADCASCP